MMRVAITQRVDDVAAYRERRDALDQRWAARLQALGMLPVPVPNALPDPAAWALALGIQALLLSGGNDIGGRAPERDRTETELLRRAEQEGWPVLGVCRGLQVMNCHAGGRLAPVAGHVGLRHRLFPTGALPRLLVGVGDEGVEVNSFHNFGIPAALLAPDLVPVLCDDQGFVEAAEHRRLRWAGIMWHPEREPAPAALDDAWLRQLFSPP